jgi:hypothetical protein
LSWSSAIIGPSAFPGQALEGCVDFWIKCMQHPSYLQVGGRRVFKIHGSGAFIEQCAGDAAQSNDSWMCCGPRHVTVDWVSC